MTNGNICSFSLYNARGRSHYINKIKNKEKYIELAGNFDEGFSSGDCFTHIRRDLLAVRHIDYRIIFLLVGRLPEWFS
jgi:hypothetical protein